MASNGKNDPPSIIAGKSAIVDTMFAPVLVEPANERSWKKQ